MQKRSPLANQCLWASNASTSLSGCPYLWVSPSLSLRCFCFSIFISRCSYLCLSSSGSPHSVCPSLRPSPCLGLSPTHRVCRPLCVSLHLCDSGLPRPCLHRWVLTLLLLPISASPCLSRSECSSGECFLPSLVHLVAVAQGQVSREQG